MLANQEYQNFRRNSHANGGDSPLYLGPSTVGPSTTNHQPSSDDDGFERFWKSYPRKVGKKAAKRAFVRALKDASLCAILAALSIDAAEWKEERIYAASLHLAE